ncbi:MAG TPA: SPOR domain-containing protein, partial [Novosphingobium sp.]|nr:SPOR domain-containing protein [Novosphingobium sp.]
AVLDAHRSDIPAGDLGLALALAGESSRGVAILADAVRGGENTPKLRQNLAYAYALDGRWAEAKVMAAQDVPADQLDRRMAIWALSALPDRSRDRVAGLLGAPVRRDAGQPAALALHTGPAAPQKAEMAVAPEAELPAAVAAASAPTVETNLAVQSAPAIADAPHAPVVATRHAPALASLVQAFGGREFQMHKFQPAAAVVPAKRVHAIAAAMARPVAGGTHVVQLGAFSNERNARRAWAIYTHQNPSLAAYRPVIVPAVIKGRQLWRVAAGGLADRFAANGLCGNLRAHGSACFAYALPARAMPMPAGPMQQAGAFQRARR